MDNAIVYLEIPWRGDACDTIQRRQRCYNYLIGTVASRRLPS